jgi:hypothetical protein
VKVTAQSSPVQLARVGNGDAIGSGVRENDERAVPAGDLEAGDELQPLRGHGAGRAELSSGNEPAAPPGPADCLLCGGWRPAIAGMDIADAIAGEEPIEEERRLTGSAVGHGRQPAEMVL